MLLLPASSEGVSEDTPATTVSVPEGVREDKPPAPVVVPEGVRYDTC